MNSVVAAGAIATRAHTRRELRGGRSLIAGANALMRMKETTRAARARILDDRFAGRLADGHPLLQAIRYARFVVPPLWLAIDELQTAHCVRHRAIDELVLRAVEEGFEQIVIIGAGWDMRASRFAAELAGVRVIELDLPPLSALKHARVSELADAAGAVEHAVIDLRVQSVREALRATSFDAARPALFVLEGVVHYLPRARVEALLGDLAAGPGARRVALSYIRPEVYRVAGGPLIQLVRLLREIPRLTFSRDELTSLASACGFPSVQSWTFAEQVAAFAPQAAGRRVGATQDVALLAT